MSNTINSNANTSTIRSNNLTTDELYVKNNLSFFGVDMQPRRFVNSTNLYELVNVFREFGLAAPNLWNQQEGPIVGKNSNGDIGTTRQGTSIAISGDGNTFVIGGPSSVNGSNIGGIWIFNRTGTVWTQQAGPLVGTGATGQALQGTSVSISDNGNTVIVGGPGNNTNVGAVWVFTRTGFLWTQQAGPLIGTGLAGQVRLGISVSVSFDGNTFVAGGTGPLPNNRGVIWVFSRSGSSWTQVAGPFTGNASNDLLGTSVSMSGNGLNILAGCPRNNSLGFVKAYKKIGSVWSFQQDILMSGMTGQTQFGFSISMSYDGSTAIIGGPRANAERGAIWIYKQFDSIWSHSCGPLGGSGLVPLLRMGASVSMDYNGISAIIGGPTTSTTQQGGTTWIFEKTSEDCWSQSGSQLVGYIITPALYGTSVAFSGDGSTVVGGPQNQSARGGAWVFINN
jgi:hypothetical protein